MQAERELEAARADAEHRRSLVQKVTRRASTAAAAVQEQISENHFGETIRLALEGERGKR